MSRPAPDPVYLLRGSDSPITSLRFLENKQTSDETVLASGNMNGYVQLWDLKTYRCTLSFICEEFGKSVLWIDEVPGNGDLVTQSRAGNISHWSRTESTFVKTDSVPTAPMGFCAGCAVHQSSSSLLLAVPSVTHQSQVDLIDLHNNQLITHLNPPSSNKEGMCMTIKPVNCDSNVNHLLIGYESGNILLWDIKSQKILNPFKAHKETVMCLDYSSSKRRGISGSADCGLSAWTIDTEWTIEGDKTVEITNPGVNSIAIRNDDKLFVTAGWDSRIRLFGLKKLQPLAVLTCHTDSVHCVTFSADNMLACGSKDKRISLWDIYK